jgi:hypothetical protein
VVAVALVLPAVFYFGIRYDQPWTNANDAWGQSGDFIGGVLNPIFGFFAFVAPL